MIVCTNCGNHNQDADEFCGSCGKFLEWVGQKVADPVQPEVVAEEPAAEEARAGLIDRVKAAVGIEGAASGTPPVEAATTTIDEAPPAPSAEDLERERREREDREARDRLAAEEAAERDRLAAEAAAQAERDRVAAEAASAAAAAAQAAAEEEARRTAEEQARRERETSELERAAAEAAEAAERQRLEREAREAAVAEEAARREAEEAAARARAEEEARRAAEAEEIRRRAEEERARREAEQRAEAARRAAALLAQPKAPAAPPADAPAAPAATEAPVASSAAPMSPTAPTAKPPTPPPAAAPPAAAAAPAAMAPSQEPAKPKAPPKPATQIKVDEGPKPGDLICDGCGTGNDPTRKFCRRCGNSLAKAEPVKKVPWWKRLFGRKKQPKASKGGKGKAAVKGARQASFKAEMAMARLRNAVLLLAVLGIGIGAMLPSPRAAVMGGVRDGINKARDTLFPNFDPIRPVAVTASSETPGHPAAQAADLAVNTYWAEAAEGDGIGQTISFTFPRQFELAKILITPGAIDTAAPDLFLKNPRPKVVHLVFDNGGSTDLTLKDEVGKAQTFTVKGAKGITKVDISITEVHPGTGGQDTAIAEVEFREKA